MFESLSDKLHDVFRKLRGQSTLTESNIADAMREIAGRRYTWKRIAELYANLF